MRIALAARASGPFETILRVIPLPDASTYPGRIAFGAISSMIRNSPQPGGSRPPAGRHRHKNPGAARDGLGYVIIHSRKKTVHQAGMVDFAARFDRPRPTSRDTETHQRHLAGGEASIFSVQTQFEATPRLNLWLCRNNGSNIADCTNLYLALSRRKSEYYRASSQ
jgi:hypothetical protein